MGDSRGSPSKGSGWWCSDYPLDTNLRRRLNFLQNGWSPRRNRLPTNLMGQYKTHSGPLQPRFRQISNIGWSEVALRCQMSTRIERHLISPGNGLGYRVGPHAADCRSASDDTRKQSVRVNRRRISFCGRPFHNRMPVVPWVVARLRLARVRLTISTPIRMTP